MEPEQNQPFLQGSINKGNQESYCSTSSVFVAKTPLGLLKGKIKQNEYGTGT